MLNILLHINYIKGTDGCLVQHRRKVSHFFPMDSGDRPMGVTEFSSFLIIIMVPAGVFLDAAGTQ